MRRLPVNLATHPIEGQRWVRKITIWAAAALAIVTLLHFALAWSLLNAAPPDEPDTSSIELLRSWSLEAAEMARAADAQTARRLAVSVGLSNALIDQRVFPWGGLLGALEESLPDEVRLEQVQPVAALEGVRVTISAASASGDALLAFLAALEERDEFAAVYPGRQLLAADGELRLTIEALARNLESGTGAQ